MLMDNGLSFDSIKCTAYGRRGRLNQPQSDCTLGESVVHDGGFVYRNRQP